MIRFTLRRLALSLVTLFILIFVVFMMTWLTPGDPAGIPGAARPTICGRSSMNSIRPASA